MVYSVIWSYNVPESGQLLKLMSPPEACEGIDSDEKAKNEGRMLLMEVSQDYRSSLRPLAVVEISDEMAYRINQGPKISIPGVELEDEELEIEEVEMRDISDLDFWVNKSWWHR